MQYGGCWWFQWRKVNLERSIILKYDLAAENKCKCQKSKLEQEI
jgi:hypothetical protein